MIHWLTCTSLVIGVMKIYPVAIADITIRRELASRSLELVRLQQVHTDLFQSNRTSFLRCPRTFRRRSRNLSVPRMELIPAASHRHDILFTS